MEGMQGVAMYRYM